MQEPVAVYSDAWVDALKEQIDTGDLVRWLCVAWVFKRQEEFTFVTELLVRDNGEDLKSGVASELPSPETVIGE